MVGAAEPPSDGCDGFPHGSSAHRSFDFTVVVFLASWVAPATGCTGDTLKSRLVSARGELFAPRPIVACGAPALSFQPAAQSSVAE